MRIVIREGQPVYEVRMGDRCFWHRDRWQAEVVAHSWAAISNPTAPAAGPS